ncbi:MAG: thiolase family protein [Ignavibacteriales bacterium]|nr:thiolase family protein [Ignavibacteriales bacterium]
MKEVVIVSACRTPIGSFGGTLSSLPAPKLGAIVIEESLKRTNVAKESVNEVIMGNVIQAGVGQAPARQAAIYAGLPSSVECMTVNKVCGSGLKSVMLAAQAIQIGDADVIVAGGMESMSNAPFLLDKARFGYKMGSGEIQDAMMKDGLLDAYKNSAMGNFSDETAVECKVSRQEQDEFAILSYKRAQESMKSGRFKDEIVKVGVAGKKGEVTFVEEDEEPMKTNFDKIPQLKPAFSKEGTATAANSSKINDGAAALVLMSAEKAKELNLKPIARIVAQASAAKNPERFTTAPADVIPKVLKKANLTLDKIDLFEVNEAFALVALAVNKIAGIDVNKVNVNGGAVALGHPIGASGARILVTLLHALKQRNMKRGLAAICIGGGEASSVVIEMI